MADRPSVGHAPSMKKKLPSHTTVIAYLAFFGMLATGGAYAIDKIATSDIERGAVTSPKIADQAVKGKDLASGAVGPRQLRDGVLDVGQLRGGEFGDCDPTASTLVTCASVSVELKRSGRILAVASAGQFSQGGPASARCQVRIDGLPSTIGGSAGETVVDNTDLGAANGFSRTAVSGPLEAGSHQVTLACGEFAGNVRLESPTLAALGLAGS